MPDQTETAPSVDGARRLADELGLHPGTPRRSGSVGVGASEYYVYLFDQQKKPPLVKWEGVPIQWRIGGGRPVAA